MEGLTIIKDLSLFIYERYGYGNGVVILKIPGILAPCCLMSLIIALSYMHCNVVVCLHIKPMADTRESVVA